MKKLSYLFIAIFTLAIFQSCEEADLDTDLNYVTFAEPTYTAGVDIGGSTVVDVVVYTSNITGSDRSFDVMVDPSSTAASGSYQVPSSVTIPGGSNEGVLSVTLSDVDLGIGVNQLILDFVAASGQDFGDSIAINYTQNCNEISATFEIVFDQYGSEVGWYILDSLGGVVVSADAGTYADGQATATENLTLCQGRNYTFVFTDSFGDGMLGSYTLTVDGVVKVVGGGAFGSEESNDFDTN